MENDYSVSGGYFHPYPGPTYISLAPPSNPSVNLTSLQVLGDLSLSDPYGINSSFGGMTGGGRVSGYSPGGYGTLEEMLESEAEEDKKTDPFSPEATIPLPFQFGDLYYGPTAIWKRNERERHRVRCVNEGYEKLRSILPAQDREKRLSKVETLRLAIRYIGHLEALLVDEEHYKDCECNLYYSPGSEKEDSSDEDSPPAKTSKTSSSSSRKTK